ncbi:MAG: ArsR/SmtB family transcription factor [Blastocatellia bacterium]
MIIEQLFNNHHEVRMSKASVTKKRLAALPVPDTCEQLCYDAPLVAQLKAAMLPDTAVMDMAATFEVLSDPTRIRIIHALSREELCVCDLAHLLSMSLSAVSHQLRRLRDLRLVKHRSEGRMAFYSLDDEFTRRLLIDAVQHVESL